MVFKTRDAVLEYTQTVGLGNIILQGPKPTFQSFKQAGYEATDTFYYRIQSEATSEFETGVGTYIDQYTIERTSILASSSTTDPANPAKVDFLPGIKNIYVIVPASKSLILDPDGNLEADGINEILGSENIEDGSITPAKLSDDVGTPGFEDRYLAGVVEQINAGTWEWDRRAVAVAKSAAFTFLKYYQSNQQDRTGYLADGISTVISRRVNGSYIIKVVYYSGDNIAKTCIFYTPLSTLTQDSSIAGDSTQAIPTSANLTDIHTVPVGGVIGVNSTDLYLIATLVYVYDSNTNLISINY